MNLEDNVKQWLSDEDLLREMKYDENADFHYIIEFPKENIMDVVKPRGKDCIVLACATQVAPQHTSLMQSSDDKTRKDFILHICRAGRYPGAVTDPMGWICLYLPGVPGKTAYGQAFGSSLCAGEG